MLALAQAELDHAVPQVQGTCAHPFEQLLAVRLTADDVAAWHGVQRLCACGAGVVACQVTEVGFTGVGFALVDDLQEVQRRMQAVGHPGGAVTHSRGMAVRIDAGQDGVHRERRLEHVRDCRWPLPTPRCDIQVQKPFSFVMKALWLCCGS